MGVPSLPSRLCAGAATNLTGRWHLAGTFQTRSWQPVAASGSMAGRTRAGAGRRRSALLPGRRLAMRCAFGDCTLDTDLYALYRVDRPVLLRAKVFQVLHYLLTHRGRVVSKQELCEQVWAGQVISDAAVEGVVKAVRQAVGDTGRAQWCIQTRRGHGYWFVAPVTMLAPSPGLDRDAPGLLRPRPAPRHRPRAPAHQA
jgi:DNA-binding winged helix-turn-helix (wHTH) protein